MSNISFVPCQEIKLFWCLSYYQNAWNESCIIPVIQYNLKISFDKWSEKKIFFIDKKKKLKFFFRITSTTTNNGKGFYYLMFSESKKLKLELKYLYMLFVSLRLMLHYFFFLSIATENQMNRNTEKCLKIMLLKLSFNVIITI